MCVFGHMRQYNLHTYTPISLYSNSILYHNRLCDSAAHDHAHAASPTTKYQRDDLNVLSFTATHAYYIFMIRQQRQRRLKYIHDCVNGDRNDQQSPVIWTLYAVSRLHLGIFSFVNETNTQQCAILGSNELKDPLLRKLEWGKGRRHWFWHWKTLSGKVMPKS